MCPSACQRPEWIAVEPGSGGGQQGHRIVIASWCHEKGRTRSKISTEKQKNGTAQAGRTPPLCPTRTGGGRRGVVLEEAEDHHDVPAKVDDADEDDQVDDLA